MYTVDQGSQINYLIIAIIIISFVLSFIAPFALLAIFQDIFFFSREHWVFQGPPSAYITLGASFLWISIILSIYIIFKFKREDKNKKAPHWMLIAGFPVAILLIILAINNYYFFEKNGFAYNTLFAWEQQKYQWSDVQEIDKVYEKNEGTIFLKQIIFHLNDGETIEISYGQSLWDYQRKIISSAEASGAAIRDNLAEIRKRQ
ncbi:hypothetical protein [Thalassobacillus pellis]|uniref:hypothetical protein n=1 Tax=Thalassobacillus pellis TaxID=748008 RepID=UPI001961E7CA|nr:hypothetical protein [Thalassobacillus pellis]MBM7552250.1 hypothetical protein [Thalassobacillus pellis]